MARLIPAFMQFFDNEGKPLENGWLKFLESGTNNTLKDTYADEQLQIPNANPLQLDGSGRCSNVFGVGRYRIALYTQNIEDETDVGELIQIFDPVYPPVDSSSGGGGGSGFPSWSSTETYNLKDIVVYDLKYYRSLINNNINLIPSIETSSWEEIKFLPIWNADITYDVKELVYYDNNLYISTAALNLGNQPDISPNHWRAVASGYYNVSIKTGAYEILPTERDILFILSGSATANATFTLPALDATASGFRVALYNASDYELTISPQGLDKLWIDSSNNIVLQKGALIELIYISDLTAWLSFGNVASILGLQELGTSTSPISDIYATLLHTTTIPKGEKLNFGIETAIEQDNTTDYLTLDTVGNGYSFKATGSELWRLESAGNIIPVTGSKQLGSATDKITLAYIDQVKIGTNGQLILGDSDNLSITFDGSVAKINSVNELQFLANSVEALKIGTDRKITIPGEGILEFNDPAGSTLTIYNNTILWSRINASRLLSLRANNFQAIEIGHDSVKAITNYYGNQDFTNATLLKNGEELTASFNNIDKICVGPFEHTYTALSAPVSVNTTNTDIFSHSFSANIDGKFLIIVSITGNFSTVKDGNLDVLLGVTNGTLSPNTVKNTLITTAKSGQNNFSTQLIGLVTSTVTGTVTVTLKADLDGNYVSGDVTISDTYTRIDSIKLIN